MLQKNNTKKVLDIFLKEPQRKFFLREIARLSKISTTAAKRAVLELIKSGLVKKSKERLWYVYSADSDSEKFKATKRFYNIERLRESGLIDFIDEKFRRPDAIVLFGSSARGEDNEKSDIDIFILVSEKKEVGLEKFENLLKQKVSVMQMTKKEFETAKKKSPELVNNIANGILLKGYLEVVR